MRKVVIKVDLAELGVTYRSARSLQALFHFCSEKKGEDNKSLIKYLFILTTEIANLYECNV